MALDIKHDEGNQQFTAYVDNEEIGELAYALPGDKIIDFQHTYIEDQYRGKGLANELIQHALDHAKKNGLEIRATCTAVATYLKKNPQT